MDISGRAAIMLLTEAVEKSLIFLVMDVSFHEALNFVVLISI